MKFIKLFLVITALSLASIGYCKDSAHTEEFVVGTASGYAPYVSLNEQGEYEGFDIDLANLVAQRMNKKLVLKDLGSMPSLLVALKKKKIDSIIWAMSITESRTQEMEMVYYQGEKITEMPFLFWKDAPKDVKTIEDLAKVKNCTICVESGSYQDFVLQKYPNLKLRYLDKITDGIMEIKYGKANSAIIDHTLVHHVQAQYPELKVINLPLPNNQQSLGNGICLNKENKELNAQVAKIIADLRAEGKIAELEKKWDLSN